MGSTAFYAGSFDPVTVGHIDIVRRAASLFDVVVVGVGVNPSKRGWFSPEQRVELFQSALHDAGLHAKFVVFSGLAVTAAADAGATVLLRGLRGPGDIDMELRNAAGNRDLAEFETLWLAADPRWSFVSSSLVKEIASCSGDVSRYVPAAALRAIEAHLQTPGSG